MTIQSHSQLTNMPDVRIDHVLIAVSNLDSAKAEYEKYGFTVVYGGPPNKAVNALIFRNPTAKCTLIRYI